MGDGLDDGREGLQTPLSALCDLGDGSVDDPLRPQIGGVRAARRPVEVLPATLHPAVAGSTTRGMHPRTHPQTGEALVNRYSVLHALPFQCSTRCSSRWGRPGCAGTTGRVILRHVQARADRAGTIRRAGRIDSQSPKTTEKTKTFIRGRAMRDQAPNGFSRSCGHGAESP